MRPRRGRSSFIGAWLVAMVFLPGGLGEIMPWGAGERDCYVIETNWMCEGAAARGRFFCEPVARTRMSETGRGVAVDGRGKERVRARTPRAGGFPGAEFGGAEFGGVGWGRG